MADLDPSVAAALALHKPREVDYVTFTGLKATTAPRASHLDHKLFYECIECDGYAWPCDTAKALGVPGEPNTATSLLEARTWWWQAHGLGEEAAAVAAALEEGA